MSLNTEEGYPDGLDVDGAQKYIKVTSPLAYGYGFLAAAVGLQSDVGVMKKGQPYRLSIDPIAETVKLFSDWKALQVLKLFEVTGLTPSKFEEKSQLLDLADLFAYSSGRALSEASERNKEVCKTIYGMANCIKTDFWWNPDNTMDPKMASKLNL